MTGINGKGEVAWKFLYHTAEQFEASFALSLLMRGKEEVCLGKEVRRRKEE